MLEKDDFDTQADAADADNGTEKPRRGRPPGARNMVTRETLRGRPRVRPEPVPGDLDGSGYPAAADARPHVLVEVDRSAEAVEWNDSVVRAYVREPGTPWKPLPGWSHTDSAALADLMAKSASHDVTVTSSSAYEVAPSLVDDLDDAVVKVPTLVLLGSRPTTAVLIENDEAELIGDVQAGVMVRMAVERPDYPYEIWSRPAWRWIIEREAA